MKIHIACRYLFRLISLIVSDFSIISTALKIELKSKRFQLKNSDKTRNSNFAFFAISVERMVSSYQDTVFCRAHCRSHLNKNTHEIHGII